MKTADRGFLTNMLSENIHHTFIVAVLLIARSLVSHQAAQPVLY